jgi:LysM repeat protein
MKHYHLLVLSMLVLVAPVLAADPLTHVVKKGETMYGIARQYGIALDRILTANNVEDATKVMAGTRLIIPGHEAQSPAPTKDYTVQRGDTLYSIGRKLGISTEDLQKTNNLAGTTILPGQVLKVPQTAGSAAGSNVPAPTGSGSSGSSLSAAGASPTGTSNAGSSSVPSGRPVASAAGPSATPSPQATPESTAAPGRAPVQASAVVPATPVRVETPAWPVSGMVSYLQGKLKGASISSQSGASLVAVRSGTVISAGPFRGFGRVAFVQATDGLVYVYGGATSLAVRVGDSVRRGTVLGSLDQDEGALAYFFVFKGQDAIDPATAPRD